MHRTVLGDNFARSMNIPLADLVYLQRRPIPLLPPRLHRRLHRLLGNDAERPAARDRHRRRTHDPRTS